MFGLNEFQLAIGLGVVLFVLCFIVIVVEAIWCVIYGFIDDSDVNEHSGIITKLAASMGYRERSTKGIWRFYDSKNEMQSGIWVFMNYAIPLSLSPIVIVLAFKLYAITLFLISGTALLFLARFVMRSKKLFSKHVADKDAHKV
jgi:hypothetical protein